MRLVWLGHGAFRVEAQDTVLLVDPFLKGNPNFDDAHYAAATKGCTHIALTHGHGDHIGDTLEIAAASGAKVICNYDLGQWLVRQGADADRMDMGNTGGTLKQDGFTATFVDAKHSASIMSEDGMNHALGSANGLVFHFENGPSVYHMGDTDIFSDMALINELHQPAVGLVPIGDRFTMGSAVAALACRRYFNFQTVVPCHYGTFPILEQGVEPFVKAMEDKADTVRAVSIGEVIEF